MDQLEKNVKDIVKDFVVATGRDPLSNNSLYYLLDNFCKKPSNQTFKEGLWEKTLKWVAQVQEELEKEKETGKKKGESKSYEAITKPHDKSGNFAKALICYDVIVEDIKNNCAEKVTIEDVIQLYQWLKYLPFTHFAPLITEVWERFHSKEAVCENKTKQTLADFKSCIKKNRMKCFICLCSGGLPKLYKDFQQHLVEVHSIFIYPCDVEGCTVTKKAKRLILIHKAKDHCGKGELIEENLTEDGVEPPRKKRTTMSQSKTRSAQKGNTMSKGRKLKGIENTLMSSSSRLSSSPTEAALRQELYKHQIALQNAQWIVNHNKSTIENLVSVIQDKLGHSELELRYRHLEGYPNAIFPEVVFKQEQVSEKEHEKGFQEIQEGQTNKEDSEKVDECNNSQERFAPMTLYSDGSLVNYDFLVNNHSDLIKVVEFDEAQEVIYNKDGSLVEDINAHIID